MPAALIVRATIASSLVRRVRHRTLSEHAHEVLIVPPPVDPAGAPSRWANMYEVLSPSRRRRFLSAVPHVAMEYRWAGRQLTIHMWPPGTVATGPVTVAVRAAWPGASTAVTDAAPPVPVPDADNGVRDDGGALALAMPAWPPRGRPRRRHRAGLYADPRATRRPGGSPKARNGATALRTGRPPGGGILDPTT